MKRYLLFVFIIAAVFFLQQGLSAQNNSESVAPGMAPGIPVPGYAILSNGDTIPGKLRWSLKYVENNPVEIKFIAENGNSKFFTAANIKGFGNQVWVYMDNDPIPVLMDMENYVSLPSVKKGVPVFYHRLIEGKITVYQNRSAVITGGTTVHEDNKFDGIRFTFSFGEGLSIGPSYTTEYRVIKARSRYSSYYVSKENGPLVKVDKDDYETHIKELFGDCQAIADEIAKNPDLTRFRNFMILTEVYNRLCEN
jgi:hypothetical protein